MLLLAIQLTMGIALGSPPDEAYSGNDFVDFVPFFLITHNCKDLPYHLAPCIIYLPE